MDWIRTPAPIALFVYNRVHHTRRTVEALARNEMAAQSELHVFSDGPHLPEDEAKVEDVREYVARIEGFRAVHVHTQARNRGASASLLSGIEAVCEQFGRVIVVEDDLVTSPYFLRYLNQGLALYEDDPEVVSVHGYMYPTGSPLPESFFLRGADCWGWGTWKRGWAHFNPDGGALLEELERRGLETEFDFNGTYGFTEMLRDQCAGRSDSWAIRWYASAFLREKLTLYPGRSLVQPIGSAIGSECPGRNGDPWEDYVVRLSNRPVKLRRLPVREDVFARRIAERYFRELSAPPLSKRIRRRLRRFWRARREALYGGYVP
ncbi:MAG: hypothetical protein RLZZ244_1891 [Verrucomicrobiota bacterium]